MSALASFVVCFQLVQTNRTGSWSNDMGSKVGRKYTYWGGSNNGILV